VPSEGKPLASMPKAPKGAEWAAPVKVIEHTVYRADGGGYLEPGFTHLFVVPADGGAPRQVTRGEFDVFGAPVWARRRQPVRRGQPRCRRSTSIRWSPICTAWRWPTAS
jgi:hypothetical protein